MIARRTLLALFLASAWLAGQPGVGAAADNLMGLSLEELMAYKITTASKKAEPLRRTAAAVHVLTREDLRRSGYTSVAEALRLVPGVHVARTNSHDWEIGARGFNTGLSNKLLVLIDGRSVYSPLFAGVFWELQDVPVAEIDRIEVIRGPGGALWGANAVNGVINIITRSAAESGGLVVHAGAGTEERGFGYLRWGAQVDDDLHLRLSANGFHRDNQFRGNPGAARAPDDSWWLTRGRLRADWAPGDGDRLTLLGQVFGGELSQSGVTPILTPPYGIPVNENGDRTGTSWLARWQRVLSPNSDATLQLWYDYTNLQFVSLRERRHTVDLDWQHRLRPFERHELVWGSGYRFSADAIDARGATTLDPDERGIHLVTAFVQNQIALVPDRLDVTVGSKFEWNQFTGFEFQPSGRIAWTPSEVVTLWGSASRAVRTPTRLEDDSDLAVGTLPPGSPSPFADPDDPTLLILEGNKKMDSEKVVALELGARGQPHELLSVDAAVFFNLYEDLGTFELGPRVFQTDPVDHYVVPFTLNNRMDGRGYGAELAAWWQVRPWWRLYASYTFLELDLDIGAKSLDVGAEAQQGSSPEHQALLRSSLDLPNDLQLDGILRFVDELPASSVDRYLELDVRLGWRFGEHWEIALVGQNLLDGRHREASGTNATKMKRGVYGQLRWNWVPE